MAVDSAGGSRMKALYNIFVGVLKMVPHWLANGFFYGFATEMATKVKDDCELLVSWSFLATVGLAAVAIFFVSDW